MPNSADAALNRIYAPAGTRRTWVGVAILAAWAGLVVAQIARHVLWRDEVRALSFARYGDTIVDMLKGLHGEGHPALWYLMLRAAYDTFGRVEVLPGLAFLAALAAVALLIFRSPFSRALTLALVASHAFLFEYSVMARNYGISALLLFVIADSYRARRDRGIWLGLLLFGLANTNVVAAIMVGAFLLFWLSEVWSETGPRWSPQARSFLLNASIAATGILVCGLTILPTFNDAATRDWSHASPLVATGLALIDPAGTSLGALTFALPSALGSALLFGCAFGLLPNRAAFAGALAGLLVAAVFFAVAAQGDYRHAGVWLMFCVALYWIVWKDLTSAPSGGRIGSALRLARWALPALLLLQAFAGLQDVRGALLGQPVASRAAELADFVAAHGDLQDAIIVAEPDYLAETLPYYLPNRTYLPRERKFGSVNRYSKAGRLDLDLGDILEVCQDLHRSTGAPILVLLAHRLDQIHPGSHYAEGYNWSFSASAEQIQQFAAATTPLRRFGPATMGEAFDVYRLN